MQTQLLLIASVQETEVNFVQYVKENYNIVVTSCYINAHCAIERTVSRYIKQCVLPPVQT